MRSYMAKRVYVCVCADVRCSMCNRQSVSVKTNAAVSGPKKE